MIQLQDWAVALCSMGIGCALLHALCPNGTMRRVFGVLTSVFFFCCLLSPLKTLVNLTASVFAFPEEVNVSTALTEEVNEQTEQILAQTLLADAQSRVSEFATVKKVTVFRDITRTDGIYIERVRVTLDKEDRAVSSAVRAALEQAWGVMVEVYYVG